MLSIVSEWKRVDRDTTDKEQNEDNDNRRNEPGEEEEGGDGVGVGGRGEDEEERKRKRIDISTGPDDQASWLSESLTGAERPTAVVRRSYTTHPTQQMKIQRRRK